MIPPCLITVRAHVPGGIYFFTVNTYRRQTFLTDADVRSTLREANRNASFDPSVCE